MRTQHLTVTDKVARLCEPPVAFNEITEHQGRAVLRDAEVSARRAGAHHLVLRAFPADRDLLHEHGFTRSGSSDDEGNELIEMSKPLPVLRDATDDDSHALIELITGCFDEYEGCVMDVDGEEPWLRKPATSYAGLGGHLWVYSLGGPLGEVVACGALKPSTAGRDELKSMYVSKKIRRRRLAQDLNQMIENAARERGNTMVHLWSDTRFLSAHKLYAELGYRRLPEVRELHDKSNTSEIHFEKHL
ncbi:acetyltransferase (GNAT) family protein [Antricoccus suffuscus]|uniref:Acetyltransferase (GNAT) family protein n=1 Tax=Antricoccus suffuscus TaxID=1629062 RepID=A0A2T0Z5P5_9ACTN|nr:GNAT family N-acetyltransferase [Antricoccus suffuscus]PRZ31681.1 acetyltransferase (GNAT) family protein [Antricoccus suffuscus]